MARPRKLNPERQQKLVDAIRAGNYQETAAIYAGIGVSTFYRWMQEAAEPGASTELVEFREAVERAKAESEIRAVTLINTAAQQTWQAAAWYLERSYPQRWGRFQRTEISGPDGGPIQTTSRGEEALVAALEKFLDEGNAGELDGSTEEADA